MRFLISGDSKCFSAVLGKSPTDASAQSCITAMLSARSRFSFLPGSKLIGKQKRDHGNIKRVLGNILYLIEWNITHQPTSTGDALEVV